MSSSDTMGDTPLPMRWLDLIQALNEREASKATGGELAIARGRS